MKTLHLFATVAVAFLMVACSSKPTINYMPAKEHSDDEWGLVDANGEFLFEDEFKNRPSAVINGIFYVEEGDGYTVYRAEKHPKQIADLSDLHSCGFYNEGLMPVTFKNEHISFVDDNGKVKFTLEKADSVQIKRCSAMFVNGRCAFETAEHKWGAIDTNGNIVIEPKYDEVVIFTEDYAIVRDKTTHDVTIIDKNGNIKADINEDIESFEIFFMEGYTTATIKDTKEGRRDVLISTSGEIIKLPTNVKGVSGHNNQYIIYYNGEHKCGVMTFDGEVTVRPKYDVIEILPNGKFLGVRDDKTMYINPKDGETTPLPRNTCQAINNAGEFATIFDFDFELISTIDDGEDYILRKYDGQNVGKYLERFGTRLKIGSVFSDYFDYESIVNSVVSLFDKNGLKGYSFDSNVSQYAIEHPVEWYRRDRSLSVTADFNSPYFTCDGLTLTASNPIAIDTTPSASYYTWEFNPQARVIGINLTLDFGFENYRKDLPQKIADALNKKYDLGLTCGDYMYGDQEICTNGYSSIKFNISEYDWTSLSTPAAEEATVETQAEEATDETPVE